MGILGGAGGTGVRIATASVRTGFAMTGRVLQGVRWGGPSGKSAKRCQWQRKRAGFEEVPRLAATTVAGNRLARRWATVRPYGGYKGCNGRATARVAPTKGLQGVRYKIGGRGRTPPLRKGCMGCNGRATARVAPTEGYKGCGKRADVGIGPYGVFTDRISWGGLLRCIRGAFCSARRYYGPPGPRFGPGRDRR